MLTTNQVQTQLTTTDPVKGWSGEFFFIVRLNGKSVAEVSGIDGDWRAILDVSGTSASVYAPTREAIVEGVAAKLAELWRDDVERAVLHGFVPEGPRELSVVIDFTKITLPFVPAGSVILLSFERRRHPSAGCHANVGTVPDVWRMVVRHYDDAGRWTATPALWHASGQPVELIDEEHARALALRIRAALRAHDVSGVLDLGWSVPEDERPAVFEACPEKPALLGTVMLHACSGLYVWPSDARGCPGKQCRYWLGTGIDGTLLVMRRTTTRSHYRSARQPGHDRSNVSTRAFQSVEAAEDWVARETVAAYRI